MNETLCVLHGHMQTGTQIHIKQPFEARPTVSNKYEILSNFLQSETL